MEDLIANIERRDLKRRLLLEEKKLFEKGVKCFICNSNNKEQFKALIYCVREIEGVITAYCPCTNRNHIIEKKNWGNFLKNHTPISFEDYKSRCYFANWLALPNITVEGGVFNVDSTI